MSFKSEFHHFYVTARCLLIQLWFSIKKDSENSNFLLSKKCKKRLKNSETDENASYRKFPKSWIFLRKRFQIEEFCSLLVNSSLV